MSYHFKFPPSHILLKVGMRRTLILTVTIAFISGCTANEIFASGVGMMIEMDMEKSKHNPGRRAHKDGEVSSESYEASLISLPCLSAGLKLVENPLAGQDSNSCKISKAAKKALKEARGRSDNSDVIDLLNQAETAVKPPECDAVRYKILLEKACELAVIDD